MGITGLWADAIAQALPVVLGGRRDAVAVIAVANGGELESSGNLSIDVKTSTDKTNNGKGVVTLLSITASAAVGNFSVSFSRRSTSPAATSMRAASCRPGLWPITRSA